MEATMEDNIEMEVEEDGEYGVMQEATIMGETENDGSAMDKSDKSDSNSDY
jgi:hypothetical protein